MPEWYESFFTGLFVDFWRGAVTPEVTQTEARFLERELRVAPGARLLDLPCGVGRHVLALRERGFDVTGIDISAAAVAGLGLLQGDMRDPVPGGPYDGAYCFGNSFGYLTTPDTRRFARNVRDVVHQGARWIIDTGLAAESILPHPPMERTLSAGGVTYTVRSRYDEAARRIVQETTLTRGAERQDSPVSYAVYPLSELRSMLEHEGWSVVAAHGSLDGKPFVPPDRRLLLIAEAA